MILGPFSLVRHGLDNLKHLLSGGGLLWSLVGLIDANAVQVWTGVIVVVIAAFWGLWRDQKKRDDDAAERRILLKALVDANLKATAAGQPLPYPEVMQLLVEPRETKGPASG